jgi:hypothetical protein
LSTSSSLELEVIAIGGNDRAAARELVAHVFGRHVLADGDEAHLFGDLAAPRVVHLREVPVAARHPLLDPRRAQLGQPVAHVVTLRARRVVDAQRRLAAAERDLPLRNRQLTGENVHLARRRKIVADRVFVHDRSPFACNDWQLHRLRM